MKKEIKGENILKVLKVMKFVPLDWFHSYRDLKTYEIVNNLLKLKYIEISESYIGNKIVFLSKKGNERVKNLFNTPYTFRTNSSLRVNKEVYDLHSFIVFRFLMDYFLSNSEKIELINTYKYKNSEIRPTNLISKTFYVLPDLSIQGDNRVVFLEADTGGEESKKLYNKLIKYFYIALHSSSFIFSERPIHIYFSFSIKGRTDSMFDISSSQKVGKIFNYFEKLSNRGVINQSDFVYVKTREIVELFEQEKVLVYSGDAKSGWENYKKIDFISGLRNNNGWI